VNTKNCCRKFEIVGEIRAVEVVVQLIGVNCKSGKSLGINKEMLACNQNTLSTVLSNKNNYKTK